MSTATATVDNAGAAPAAKRAPRATSLNFRGSAKDREPLRLLGALRGSGTLTWSGGEAAVDYELDLFGRGEVRTTSGHIEGQLLAPGADIPGEPPSETARLRLSDGCELDIQLVVIGAAEAEFEASAAAANSYLSSRPPNGG